MGKKQEYSPPFLHNISDAEKYKRFDKHEIVAKIIFKKS
jgi:hypothetical protein